MSEDREIKTNTNKPADPAKARRLVVDESIPRYILKDGAKDHYIDGVVRSAGGGEFSYEGEPGKWLEPVNEAAREAAEDAKAARLQRKRDEAKAARLAAGLGDAGGGGITKAELEAAVKEASDVSYTRAMNDFKKMMGEHKAGKGEEKESEKNDKATPTKF